MHRSVRLTLDVCLVTIFCLCIWWRLVPFCKVSLQQVPQSLAQMVRSPLLLPCFGLVCIWLRTPSGLDTLEGRVCKAWLRGNVNAAVWVLICPQSSDLQPTHASALCTHHHVPKKSCTSQCSSSKACRNNGDDAVWIDRRRVRQLVAARALSMPAGHLFGIFSGEQVFGFQALTCFRVPTSRYDYWKKCTPPRRKPCFCMLTRSENGSIWGSKIDQKSLPFRHPSWKRFLLIF